ncbi:MAG: exo-alpha-sialidase [Ignavibacteria bacterium]|nr:exo-alpha-sialidase [Ignavibacteria bacterium]
MTNALQVSEFPSIAASGSSIQVCWDDRRDGNYEVYFKRSTDGGITWGEDKRLTNNILSQYYSCIGISGSMTHVVWYDNRVGYEEIYYKRSIDAGLTWSVDTRLTNTTSVSEYPNIAVNGDNVHCMG